MVWIVEDSPEQARRAKKLLEQHFKVRSFSDGESMLERLGQSPPPDVLLLDWQLPGMTGLELCQFLRERHDEVSLPILMITSRGQFGDSVVGLKAGANDFLCKPYDDVELLARVRTLARVGDLAKRVRHGEAQLRLLTDEVPLLISFVDKDERYRLVNRAYERWFGQPSESLVGKTLLEVIGEKAYAVLAPNVRRALRGDGFTFEQYDVPYRLGGTRDVRVTFVPRRGLSGEVEGYTALLEDISERRRMEDERGRIAEQREEELKRQSELEQQLIGIVSHDLKNPISAITMSAALLLRQTDLPERSRKAVSRILSAAERGHRMIRDLLDFTQARLGGVLPVTSGPADAHATVRQVVDELRTSQPDRSITLKQSGEGNGTWDSDRLAQVVGNLLSNALHHGAPGAPVEVSSQGEDESLVIVVHNQGDPIPTELVPRLFQPMHRGLMGSGQTERNVGLGLYIVDQVVRSHGGSVSVTSSAESGTRFTVRLPRHAPDNGSRKDAIDRH